MSKISFFLVVCILYSNVFSRPKNIEKNYKNIKEKIEIIKTNFIENLESLDSKYNILFELKKKLKLTEKNIILEINRIREAIRFQAINDLNKTDEEKNLIVNHVLRENLSERLNSLQIELQEIHNIKAETKQVENIINILNNTNIKYKKKINQLNDQLKTIHKKNKTPKKIYKKKYNKDFSYPLKNIIKIIPKGNGLYLVHNKIQDLISPEGGKIVFNEFVATLGHTVILDHGENIRTVLIGDNIDIDKIKLGKVVQKGDTIGKINNTKDSKLYVEVRVGDGQEKTVKWFH